MRIVYFRCVVVRDAMTKIPRQGPLWELGVLKEIYGDGNLEDIEEFEAEMQDAMLPPDEEMQRLAKVYGRDKDSKIPFAEIAFGRSNAGVRLLKQTMEGSIVPEPKEPNEPKTRKRAGKEEADPAPETEAADAAENPA